MRVPHSTDIQDSEDDHTGLPIRILTHNIRYDAQSRFPHERPWTERRNGMISELRYHTRHCPTSIICLQEVLHRQLLNILTGLNSKSNADTKDKGDEWAYVGVARDDGKQAGEYSPIIYRVGVWHLQRAYTMWLSPTPEVPGSMGWDAGCVRILTVAVLVSKATGEVVVAMNTHFDDQGKVSRRESAKLIVQELVKLSHRFKYDGAFLSGDLNSRVDGEAYKILNRPDSGLVDMRTRMGGMKGDLYGDENTFTGFNGKGDGEGSQKIDFIHLGTSSGRLDEQRQAIENHSQEGEGEGALSSMPWECMGYAVLPNRFEDKVYMSDHRAVVGDVVLKRN